MPPDTIAFDLVTLGETMLRLSPPGRTPLPDADALDVHVGGAESNVAAALARLGKRTAWVSALPANGLGRRVEAELRRHGVDLSLVTWRDDARLGLYFVEWGAPPRPTRVLYDRRDSAAASLALTDEARGAIRAARRLHLSGITPALGEAAARATADALAVAADAGVPASFDVNYRALLWSPAEAADALEPFCRAADLVVVAHRDAVALFGAGERRADAAAELRDRWGGCVVVTGGDEGASAADAEGSAEAAALPCEVVDRFGAGDAFVAGLLCRLLEDAPLADALRFAVALATLKLTLPGDVAAVTRAEVDALLATPAAALQR